MVTVDYVTNGIGLALMIMIIITNRESFAKNKRIKNLIGMIAVTTATCIGEILFTALNGKPGTALTFLLYFLGFWSFLANILMSYFWIKLECDFIGAVLPKKVEALILSLDAAGVLALIINFFYPIMFKYENNVYQRCDFFWIALAIGGLNIIIALIIYVVTVRKSRPLIPFRMGLFVIPLIAGIIVQTLYYGVTVIWVGVAIGITGMSSSLKNRLIFLDPLTGVYNRSFLQQMQENTTERELASITGIMVDVNDFKTINDTCGHDKGDEALIKVSNIFSEAVNRIGTVIRSGGDEFIIIVNSADPGVVEGIVNKIENECENFSNSDKAEYKLSVSMGWCSPKTGKNFDDFLKDLDNLMYEKKEEYHRLHKTERRHTAEA